MKSPLLPIIENVVNYETTVQNRVLNMDPEKMAVQSKMETIKNWSTVLHSE